jgi:SAM-dependent methyltransferase
VDPRGDAAGRLALGCRRIAVSPRDLPLPPPELAFRAYSLEGWSDPFAAYLELGAQTRNQVVDLLPADWSFDGKRVLDFGSGAGRTLRHFAPEAERGEFWACDIDGPSIEWLRANLCPPFHAWQTISVPPLALAHESFDLIYAVSVFTHLTDNSSAWLLELHRTLKPGGLLIATFMGRWTSEWFAKEPWVEDRVGKNVLYHHREWDLGGPAVLISDWWLREHWGRAFEVVRIAPQFQNSSWAVLRKREAELDPEELERPSDDPRELAALRHNVRQLQREVVAELERDRVRHEQARADQAADGERRIAELEARLAGLEGSVTWRATAPLRRVAGRLRGRA